MKKLMALMVMALTFAVVAGSAEPKADMPIPGCLPCGQ